MRRKSPGFRRHLRRNERRQARVEKEEEEAEAQRQRLEIKKAVDDAREEGFPTDLEEKEAYFLENCSRGETLSADREFPALLPAIRRVLLARLTRIFCSLEYPRSRLSLLQGSQGLPNSWRSD
jgi:hypothetical protein